MSESAGLSGHHRASITQPTHNLFQSWEKMEQDHPKVKNSGMALVMLSERKD